MILTKKRIRNIKALEGLIKKGGKFFVGIKNQSKFSDVLPKIGFSKNFHSGESILPPAVFGSISLYNAEGKNKIHKDKPMETAYRTAEWHWKEWRGRYDTVEQSKLVDVPYKRYPRTFIEPPSIEITAYLMDNKEQAIISPIFELNEVNKEKIIHTINLFLEIFGECQFFTENLEEIIKLPIKRLNWRILPPGQMPWAKLREEIKPLVNVAPKGNQAVIKYRLEKINKYKPDFAAIGEGGFRGYIILGFNLRNIYTLESLYYGNATYIFGEKWEELSKKTKAEILNQNLQTDRIIHREGWDSKIDKLLQ